MEPEGYVAGTSSPCVEGDRTYRRIGCGIDIALLVAVERGAVQQVHDAEDAGQRRAYLVADAGGKLVPGVIGFLHRLPAFPNDFALAQQKKQCQ